MSQNGSINEDTSLGSVRLTAGNIQMMSEFYQRVLGLPVIGSDNRVVRLGTKRSGMVELVADPDAPVRPTRTTGLFHLAVLVPTRLELARSIRRVVEGEWSFTGASDHLVSEAMYLNDPEGNGIEIYRDRPRDEWQRTQSGELAMASLPLDVDDIVAELSADPEPSPETAPDTHIGHVHLQVRDIPEAEEFYHSLLGFDVTVRSYPGALFVSAGGYHHHLGLNTWASAGAPPPPPGARGLDWFEIVVPDEREIDRIEGVVGSAERRAEGLLVTDPSSNRALIRVP